MCIWRMCCFGRNPVTTLLLLPSPARLSFGTRLHVPFLRELFPCSTASIKGILFLLKKKITQSCKPQFSFSSYSSATCCESLNHHKTMAREGNYILNKESKWRSALSLHHPNSNLLHSGTTCSQLATWFPPPLTFSIFSFSYGTSNPMGQGNFCPSHGEEGQRNSFLEAERFSLLYIHC